MLRPSLEFFQRSTPKPTGRSRRQPRSKAGSRLLGATLHPQLLEKRQYRKTRRVSIWNFHFCIIVNLSVYNNSKLCFLTKVNFLESCKNSVIYKMNSLCSVVLVTTLIAFAPILTGKTRFFYTTLIGYPKWNGRYHLVVEVVDDGIFF